MFLFFYENSFSLIQNVGNICWWLSLSNCHAGGKYFSVFLKILLRVLFIHFCSIQWFLWERSVHTLCSFLFQSLLAPSNSWSLSCLKHCPFYPSVLYLHSFSPSLPSLFFVSSYSLHLIKISLISLRNPFFWSQLKVVKDTSTSTGVLGGSRLALGTGACRVMQQRYV